MFLFVLSALFNYSYAKDHGNGIVIHKESYTQSDVQWYTIPNVIICKDSPYSKDTVEKAISIWKKENIKIGNVYLENNNNKCDLQSGKKNYIQIAGYRKGFNQREYYAFSWKWPYSYSQNSRYSSSIEFAKDTNDKNIKLLVHELGHALGYKHYDNKYDIMNR